MADNLEADLLELLKPSTRADVRGIAVQQILGLTGSTEGCQMITQHRRLLECVLNLLSDSDPNIRKEAVKIVINLTAEETTIQALSEPALQSAFKKTAAFLLKECLGLETEATSMCSVLTNLTREADCARVVVEVLMDSGSVGLENFVKTLCKLYEEDRPTAPAMSTVLMNLAQVPSVRRGLLEAPDRLLRWLLPIISLSPALSACRGIVGIVQNCCFEYDFHDWLLSDEVNLLPRLLLPLAGPEEFDLDDMEKLPEELQLLPDTKEREADPEIRNMLIQSVHKLCSTKAGRTYIRNKNTYLIFRELHKWEGNGQNEDSIMDVIDLLIGDEPQEGMEDLHKVVIPARLEEEFQQSS